MSDVFDAWIYAQYDECVKILNSLNNNLIFVPKSVVSGDMDLLIHVAGVIIEENESFYTVKVDSPDYIKRQLIKFNEIQEMMKTQVPDLLKHLE